MIVWHVVLWIFCVRMNASFFDSSKPLYKIRNWEQQGRFYTKILKIKFWKDKLPQYVAKDGFSKRNLKKTAELNSAYIKKFIVETCRAEWNHFMCCAYGIISFIMNPLPYSVVFSLVVILGNVPFIAIQRYNRIRLLRVYKKIAANS